MARDNVDVHHVEEADIAYDAIATTPLTGTARAGANCEALYTDGVAVLQNFCIREARIGHVSLERGCAIKSFSRTSPPADGLIVLQPRITKSEVIHRALSGSEDSRREKERIRYGLAGFDIPGYHCRALLWIEN